MGTSESVCLFPSVLKQHKSSPERNVWHVRNLTWGWRRFVVVIKRFHLHWKASLIIGPFFIWIMALDEKQSKFRHYSTRLLLYSSFVVIYFGRRSAKSINVNVQSIDWEICMYCTIFQYFWEYKETLLNHLHCFMGVGGVKYVCFLLRLYDWWNVLYSIMGNVVFGTISNIISSSQQVCI